MLAFPFVAALLPLISSVAAAGPLVTNLPQLVKVRVEGETKTLFEGVVLTRGHNVTSASGGTHRCDGTNLDANPKPGATCTGALDDAAKLAKFEWDGSFSTSFDDYFVSTIAGQSQTSTQFWGLLLNFQLAPVGGCQQQVKNGDEAMWAFDAFSKSSFLKLSGPKTAVAGKAVTLTVKDGSTGNAVAGATVHGQISDANGQVSVVFGKKGVVTVKAEKADSVRSNAVALLVTKGSET
ncbi:hypothetical protein BDV98DRAFT_504375 [Pterulicium gracile]|uniref:Transcobalamin-like C-terminal domain-containing protein n=1 Tax=Pterulicium gracile TaxID=1884261 RepID=A0A5C3QQ24_9AGAR|nr:hypothetical protein BDV98DRAFT_504375 [Pterula gracilis]